MANDGPGSLNDRENAIMKRHVHKIEQKKLAGADVIVIDLTTAMDGRLQFLCSGSGSKRAHVSAILVDDASGVGSAGAFSLMEFHPSHIGLYGEDSDS